MLLFFAPVLFFGNALYFRDAGLYFYPHKVLLAEALRAGRLPQWNPFEYGGTPLLVDPNFNAFHPLSLLTYLVPLPLGFALFVAVHAAVAVAGTFALSRALGIDRTGSVVAALAFAWSGTYVSLVASGQSIAPSWLPWLCATGVFLGRSPSRRTAASAALVAALLFFSGTPEVGACAIFLAALFAVSVAQSGTRVRTGAVFFSTLLLGAIIAAVQILPTALFLRHSSRATGWSFAEATDYSLHPLRLLNLLFPFFAGAVDSPGASSWSLNPGLQRPYVQEIYAGGVVLLLAFAGFRSSVARVPRMVLVLASTALLPLAFGAYTPLYAFLFRAFPLVQLIRFPEKLVIPLALAIAIQAGAGWEVIREFPKRATLESFRALAMAASGAALLAIVAGGLLFFAESWFAARLGTQRATALTATLIPSAATEFALIAVAIFTLLLAALGRLRARTAAFIGSAILLVDLAVPASRLDFFLPAAAVTTPSPLSKVIRDDAAQADRNYRIDVEHHASAADVEAAGDATWPRPRKLFWLRHLALYGASSAVDGLSTARGYSGFTPGDLKSLFGAAPPAAVFDLLGVRYGIAYGTDVRASPYARAGFTELGTAAGGLVHVWKNAAAHDRLRLVGALAGSNAAGLVPPCNAAWLSAGDVARLPANFPMARDCAEIEKRKAPRGSARITLDEPEHLEAEIEATAPSLALLSDAASAGWRVTLDGADSISITADGALRAIAVPEGKHRLAWNYQTPGLAVGAAFSLIGLFVIALLVLKFGRPARAQ